MTSNNYQPVYFGGEMAKRNVALLVSPASVTRIFAPDDLTVLRRRYNIAAVSGENPDHQAPELLRQAEACITSWGSPRLDEKLLSAAPFLKLVVHAAGTVKPYVSEALWQRGIQVSSAAAAIAPGVAEHALGLMLCAMKRTCWFNEKIHRGIWRDEAEISRVMEPFGIRVGVIGLGHTGRCFLKLLRNFEVKILCYDPFFSAEKIRKLGGEKVDDLDDLIPQVEVLSLHAPSLPETRHLLNSDRLKLIKDGAILINTARGALIDEPALYQELKDGRFTACLDVTDPEPPSPDNPLLTLPNVIFTPHVAGAASQNLYRIGRLVRKELNRFFSKKPLLHQVRQEDLNRLA